MLAITGGRIPVSKGAGGLRGLAFAQAGEFGQAQRAGLDAGSIKLAVEQAHYYPAMARTLVMETRQQQIGAGGLWR